MLTSEQVEKIAVDMINGAPPRVTGREADAFRKRLERDLEFARERGWEVEIPFEILRDE
jgi:hypothetical protein